MAGKIVIYAPHRSDNERLQKIKRLFNILSRDLDIPVKGPIYRDDNRICVYYEDDDIKLYIYIDDPCREVNFEKAEMTIKLMTAMAMKQIMCKTLKVTD